MDTTLTLNDIILLLLGIAGVVLIIFLIIFVINLIKAARNANKVLEDVSVISNIASERAQDIDHIVEDVATSAQAVASSLKGKDGLVKTITSVIGLFTSLRGLMKKNKSNDETADNDEGSGTTKNPAKQQKKNNKK